MTREYDPNEGLEHGNTFTDNGLYKFRAHRHGIVVNEQIIDTVLDDTVQVLSNPNAERNTILKQAEAAWLCLNEAGRYRMETHPALTLQTVDLLTEHKIQLTGNITLLASEIVKTNQGQLSDDLVTRTKNILWFYRYGKGGFPKFPDC